jgi:hypothetical protein
MMSGPAHIGSEISRLTERVVIQLNLAILWCQAQDDNLPAENFVNYCERFNLWASGIGAPYSSDNQLSLAYKVRKAPRLESLFCDLLRDMLDDLTHRKLHHPFRCKADRAPQQSTPDMRPIRRGLLGRNFRIIAAASVRSHSGIIQRLSVWT